MRQNLINGMKYLPTHFASVLFFFLLGVVFILFSGRKTGSFRSEFLIHQLPTFYQHISNFTISYLLYVGIGYFWLLMGVKFRYILVFGFLLLLANLIYELHIPILNTPDIIDAYFGFAGTALGFIYLSFVFKFGLKLNSHRG